MADISPASHEPLTEAWNFCVRTSLGDTFCCANYTYDGEEIVLTDVGQNNGNIWMSPYQELRIPKVNVRAIIPGTFSISSNYYSLPGLQDAARRHLP